MRRSAHFGSLRTWRHVQRLQKRRCAHASCRKHQQHAPGPAHLRSCIQLRLNKYHCLGIDIERCICRCTLVFIRESQAYTVLAHRSAAHPRALPRSLPPRIAALQHTPAHRSAVYPRALQRSSTPRASQRSLPRALPRSSTPRASQRILPRASQRSLPRASQRSKTRSPLTNLRPRAAHLYDAYPRATPC